MIESKAVEQQTEREIETAVNRLMDVSASTRATLSELASRLDDIMANDAPPERERRPLLTASCVLSEKIAVEAARCEELNIELHNIIDRLRI